MSTAQLIAISGMNYFANTKPQVTFLKGKNEDGSLNKVQADFSGWDQEKGIDLKAINEISKKSKKPYVRVSITITNDNTASYFNGFLMANPKKTADDRRPDLTGTLDLTKGANGPKLDLAAWHHPAKDGKQAYYSISWKEQSSGATPAAESESAPAESKSVPVSADADIAAQMAENEDIPF